MARDLTVGEEIVNAVTHGLGLLASLAALPMLIALFSLLVWWARRGMKESPDEMETAFHRMVP